MVGMTDGDRDAVDQMLEQWRRERPDLDPWPAGIVTRLTRLGALFQRAVSENLARHELTLWEFDVLSTLRRVGEPFVLDTGRLQATMLVTSGTMTHRLDRLEKRELVAREANPADRRGVRVRLSDTGRDVIDAAIASHLDCEAALLEPIGGADGDRLAALLRRLLLSVGDDAPEPSGQHAGE